MRIVLYKVKGGTARVWIPVDGYHRSRLVFLFLKCASHLVLASSPKHHLLDHKGHHQGKEGEAKENDESPLLVSPVLIMTLKSMTDSCEVSC